MDKEEVYGKAVERWGEPAQMNQVQEECAELIQAISKYRRANNNMDKMSALSHMLEEAGDVQIMIDQIRYIVGKDGAQMMDSFITSKMSRLETLLNEEV